MLEEPLLDVNVANDVERGQLGIAVLKNKSTDVTYVFLYYTEGAEGEDEDSGGGEGQDRGRDEEEGRDNSEAIGNRLYRYELSEDGTKLVNPKMLLDLPYELGPAHNGGVIAIKSGSGYNNSNGNNNNNVCVIIGNLYVPALNKGIETNLAVNVQDGEEPDGRAGIICITEDGQKINYDIEKEKTTATGLGIKGGMLGDKHPLDMYYAYGIRNSFGLAFDPLTGNLWDTENGGFDEINLVEPGFNSGWNKISGSTE